MRARLVAACALLLSGGLGCSHNLDPLRSGRGKGATLRNSDGSIPVSRKDGGALVDGGGKTDGGTTAQPSAAACEPCDAIADAGATLGLRSCCRGAANTECGITGGQGMLCLARKVPGQTNSVCPPMQQGAMKLDGCCRPDGFCGLSGAVVDLGCAARDQVLPLIGLPKVEPIACAFTCSTDADCGGLAGGFVCTEDPADSTHKRRICVNDCTHDLECGKGQICGLGNDIGMDRVVAFCQAPLGDVAPGDTCATAQDCTTGACLAPQDMGRFCSQLCRNNTECAAGKAHRCLSVSIPTHSGTKMESFRVCYP